MKRSLLIGTILLSVSGQALANCAAIRGQAESESVRLNSPDLFLDSSPTDTQTVTIGARASLSNRFKSGLVTKGADIVCDQLQLRTEINQLISNPNMVGRDAAYRIQIAFLDKHVAKQTRIVADVDSMLRQNAITLQEVLAEKDVLAQIQLRKLRAERGLATTDYVNMYQLMDMVSRTLTLDLAQSRTAQDIRFHDSWDVTPVAGGVHSFRNGETDALIGIRMRVNTGIFRQGRIKSRTQTNIRQSFNRTELMLKVNQFREMMQITQRQNVREIALLQKQVMDLTAIQMRLSDVDTPATRTIKRTTRSKLAVVRSEIVHYQAWNGELGRMV